MYVFRDRDDKSVDDICIKKLSEAHWPKLTTLALIDCSLKGTSFEWIAKANWPNLAKLYLRKKCSIKGVIILEMRGASIWLSKTGHSLKILFWVTNKLCR